LETGVEIECCVERRGNPQSSGLACKLEFERGAYDGVLVNENLAPGNYSIA